MKVSPQYQNLAAALDPGRMAMRLQKQLKSITGDSIELKGFNTVRVFPRSKCGFTIQYRMKTPGPGKNELQSLILCGHLLGENENWPTYIEKNKHRIMVFEDLRLVIPIFPFDPELPAIAELCVTGQLPEVLKRIDNKDLFEINSANIQSIDVLGYRLERRCVIKYNLNFRQSGIAKSAPKSIVIKITRPGQAMHTENILALLNENGLADDGNKEIAIAKIFYMSEDAGIQVSEFAPGETLHNLTDGKNFVAACRSAASMIKKLHNINCDCLPSHSFENELDDLGKKVSLLSSIFPELSSDLRTVCETLKTSARATDLEFKPACVHRDFYDKQVLYSPGRTTLLDYDSIASGDSAQDIGNFTAHLILRSLQEPVHSQNIRNGLEAFEHEYGLADESLAVRKRLWQSVTLLRLACLYALRPKWQRLAIELIRIAVSTLQTNQTLRKEAKQNYVS